MPRLHRAALLAAVVAVGSGAVGSVGAQGTSPCAGRTATCADIGAFTAALTEFRTSTQGVHKVATVTLRFQNRSTRALRLGYVAGSGVATDDQGNRYIVYGTNDVRGIGQIAQQVDPKFVLQPGESSDARFELMWRPSSANEIVGAVFDLSLAVREIDEVVASQFRLGREHALSFRGLRSGTAAADGAAAAVVAAGQEPGPAAGPASAGAAPAPAAPVARPRGLAGMIAAARDAQRAVQEVRQAASGAAAAAAAPGAAGTPAGAGCGGAPRCHDAGPFTVQVLQVTGSRIGNMGDHALRLHVRLRNTGAQPMALAYAAHSSIATDELGNRYHWGRAGTYDTSVQGMGVSYGGTRADAQLVLAPGEARAVVFEVRRYGTGRNALGTAFTYDVAFDQVEVLNGGAVRVVRQHSATIPGLAVGAR